MMFLSPAHNFPADLSHHTRSPPQDQVSYLTREYEDAVQRARRLSASRDKILTGRGDATSLLAQDDVVIYLRWLVCHLHSVQTVHNFLRVKKKKKKIESLEAFDFLLYF